MKGKNILIIAFIMSGIMVGRVQGFPNYGANCGSCHTTIVTGRFQITSYDTTVNLGSGPLKTFVVSPGTTRRLSVNVLTAGGYLVLSGLEGGGQQNSSSNHLSYSPDSTWTNRTTYFTKSASSTGANGFDLTVNVGTPDDVYELTFAMAGTGGGMWYQQEHFYVQVVSAPAVDPLVANSPNGGEELPGGEAYPITWSGGEISDVIDIAYSVNNGSTWTQIATGLANVGAYSWLVPSINATAALIRVSSTSDADVSDAVFSIVWNPPSPTISGVIAASDSTPIAGVSVSANNGGGSAITDASGNYSLTVPYNWSGTVTPSKTDYTFVPASRMYTNVSTDQSGNYVGTATPLPSPTITGLIVTSSLAPIAGVSVAANNGGGSGLTDASGHYSLTVPYNWSGAITPSKAGYTFSPTSRNYSNVTGNQTGDYVGTATPPPNPTISGVIATSDTTPIAGVSVAANNGGGSAVTNASGSYSLTVPYNWSGVVTPSKTDYTFAPVSRAYSNVIANQATQNYTGTAAPLPSPTISGVVAAADATPIAGASVSANNGGGSAVTDASGSYSLTVPHNWSGTVTPGKAGYTFAPASRSHSNVIANLTCDYVGTATPNGVTIIVDNDDAGTSSVARWQKASGGGAYDGNARYCRKRDGMYIYWTSLTGTYEVSMWWPSGPNGLGVTPVLVFDGDDLLDRVFVDQSHNGGQWNVLGTYDFRTQARVAIDSIGAGSLVCADAMRFAGSLTPAAPGDGDDDTVDGGSDDHLPGE